MLVLMMFLAGCTSIGTQRPPAGLGEQYDPLRPLFRDDAEPMSDQEIARILDTVVSLPQEIRIAVVHLEHRSEFLGRRVVVANDRVNLPPVMHAFAPLAEHARAYCAAECAVLDVRTGVIPFSRRV